MTESSPDADHIEADLEHTRARLDATIDALQQKLSPGDIVDQAIGYFKEGSGAEFGRNFMYSIRDNPLPVALVTVGLAWLAVSGSRDRRTGDDRERGWSGSSRYREWEARYPDYDTRGYGETTTHQPMPYEAASYDDLASKANEAGNRIQRQSGETEDAYRERVYSAKGSVMGVTRQVGETLSTFVERVEDALSAAVERVAQVGRQVSDRASGMTDRAGSLAGSAAERGQAGARSLYGYGEWAANAVGDTAGYAAQRTRDAGDRAVDFMQERPLVVGLLGVALGAALGMMMRPTQYERQLASGMRETIRDQARGAVSGVGESVRHVAEKVLDTAHDSAQREGLGDLAPRQAAANVRQQVAGAAGRVRTVIEDTVTAGREALEEELGTEHGGDEAGHPRNEHKGSKATEGQLSGSSPGQQAGGSSGSSAAQPTGTGAASTPGERGVTTGDHSSAV